MPPRRLPRAAALLLLIAPPGALAVARETRAAATATPEVGTGSPGPFDFELQRVADDIYIAVRPDVFRQPVEGNITFIVNAEDVVVVDTGGTGASAGSAIRLLRRVTRKPVRTVINTHWHGDHHLGNAVFRREFPGVEFIAHGNTRDAMTGPPMDYVRKQPAMMEEVLKEWRSRIDTGRDETGKEMTPEEIARLRLRIADVEAAAAEYARASVVPATLTFEDRLTLRRGEREIQIRYLGRGNTEGDAVVWLPNEKILISGDLVVHPQPYGFYSFPAEWIETLGRLAGFEFRLLIPGHGAVQEDANYIRSLQALLREVRADVGAAVKEGATQEQARARIDLGGLERTFTDGVERRGFLFGVWFLDPIAVSAYREARGEPIVQGG
jgi:glyoxylase-like metal-dependent hydrolase (beta-lactamase superfamily II)